MPRKMNLNLLGEAFVDELHTDVGAAAFEIDHDWFWGGADLSINDAAGGAGAELTEGVDYQLSVPASEGDVEAGLTVRSGKDVYRKVQIINAVYQAGDLYFAGDYIADSIDRHDWHIPLLIPQPWLKSLAAKIGTTLFTGTCDADESMALKDTAEDFTDVAFGDIVQNTTSKAFATVLYKAGIDTLYLDADVFPDGNENYAVYSQPIVSEQASLQDFIELTGAMIDGDGTVVADTDTSEHLLDGDGTDWTTICVAGDWAMNLETGKIAQIMIVAAHDLTLQWDVFPDGDEKYMIFAGHVTVSDSASPLDGETIPEMNVSGRFLGGGLTAGGAEDDQIQGHFHDFESSDGAGATTSPGTFTAARNAASTKDRGHRIPVTEALTDTANGTPRTGEHTQPRTLRAVMIMRIK